MANVAISMGISRMTIFVPFEPNIPMLMISVFLKRICNGDPSYQDWVVRQRLRVGLNPYTG